VWADLRDTCDVFQKFADDGHSIAVATLPTMHILYKDTEDFTPSPQRSFHPDLTPSPGKVPRVKNGKLLTKGGIDLLALLQTSSRYFPPKSTVSEDNGGAPRAPWLLINPPEVSPFSLAAFCMHLLRSVF